MGAERQQTQLLLDREVSTCQQAVLVFPAGFKVNENRSERAANLESQTNLLLTNYIIPSKTDFAEFAKACKVVVDPEASASKVQVVNNNGTRNYALVTPPANVENQGKAIRFVTHELTHVKRVVEGKTSIEGRFKPAEELAVRKLTAQYLEATRDVVKATNGANDPLVASLDLEIKKERAVAGGKA